MIYEPKEDSFLLEKAVSKYAKGSCLDVGTGSGILAQAAYKKTKKVTALDINPKAIAFCKIEYPKIKFIISDLFSKVKGKFDMSETQNVSEHAQKPLVFDTIIFNPPYLPLDKREPKDSQLATTGGKKGYEITERFFEDVDNYLEKDGQILLLFSTLTNKQKVEEIIADKLFQFKQLSSQKLFFEELFVYQITRTPLLDELKKKLTNITKLAKGHRGIVYKAKLKNKDVAVKVEYRNLNRIMIETKFLKILNKHNIGPKLLYYTDNYFVMEFVHGERIWEFMQKATKAQTKDVIKKVFDQIYTMDSLGINKEEMHRPVKHIIVGKKVTQIDFERCKFTPKPKGITQFCQFLTSTNFTTQTKVKVNKNILNLARKYKKNPSKQLVKEMLDEIQ